MFQTDWHFNFVRARRRCQWQTASVCRADSSLIVVMLTVAFTWAATAWADNPKICIINADGSGLRTVVEMPGYHWAGSPRFSHDGKLIAFDATQDRFENDHIFVVDAEGGQPRDLGLGSRPTWSADDKQLCFFMFEGSSADDKRGIYAANIDGKSRQFVVAGTKGNWSPEGGRIVYVENQDNGPNTLWVYNLLEGQSKVLLKDKFSAILSSPAWSPNGKQVCFIGRRERAGEPELCIIDADGNGAAETKFKGPVTEDFPSWSATNRILFLQVAARGASPRAHWLDPSSSDPPTLIDFGAVELWDPCWSPDGKQIAFRVAP
jgi:Tol biopolymer transport system component